MEKIVVLSGAGMSAESGIATFRDAGGLWEGYDVMEVASPEGWRKNPAMVLEFYNQRRKNIREAQPNEGHYLLAKLEEMYDVEIVTQNIDNLHERAGSRKVLHLHGEINKAQSTADSRLIYDLKDSDIHLGDVCEKGSQLRPYIVWFGEAVPMLEIAIEKVIQADILIIIGTSLQVYPAAGLINYAPKGCKKFLIDPNITVKIPPDIHVIAEKAGVGLKQLSESLLRRAIN